MYTFLAFMMKKPNRSNQSMVFDWNLAARLIKENNVEYADAGLEGDWDYTGGAIFREGKPMPENDTYVYLASTWATPQLFINDEYIDCFIMEDEAQKRWAAELVVCGSSASIYWPASALSILNGGANAV